MRSDKMTKGREKAPHRSLLHALGLTRAEMDRPFIGVVNAANEVVPAMFTSTASPRPSKPAYVPPGARPLNFPPLPSATVWP